MPTPPAPYPFPLLNSVYGDPTDLEPYVCDHSWVDTPPRDAPNGKPAARQRCARCGQKRFRVLDPGETAPDRPWVREVGG